MSEIEEAVALAIWQARIKTKDGVETFNHLVARDEWLGCARAAIDAYERETARQDMRDQRVIWEAVERMKFTPADTPLMDALKSGRLCK